MHNRPLRSIIGLAAVGAATAVGVTTRDAGFTALTFVGVFALPRILGIGGRHRHGWAGHAGRGHCGPGGKEELRSRFEQRAQEWHRQAHGEPSSPGDSPPSTATPATA
jgi:hypothetical protein